MFEPMFAVMNEMLDDIMLRCPGCSPEERKQLLDQLTQLRTTSDQFIEQWLVFEEKLVDFQDAFPAEAAAAGFSQLAVNSSGAAASPPPASQQRLGKAKLPLLVEPFSSPLESASNVPLPPSKPRNARAEHHSNINGEKAEAISKAAELEMAYDTMDKISKGRGYFNLFMFPQAIVEFQAALDLSPECNLARLYLAMSLMHVKRWDDAEMHFKLLATLTDKPRWQAISFNALGCIQAIRLNMEQAQKLFRQAVKMDPAFEDPVINLKSCAGAPGPLSLYFGSSELA
ncbi:hypothetical protein M3223_09075 [Paenibacillus pasadenensis]|uniref:tetratricopeptide repeat protein n=1 Tax=Paenibacillus pasadenensis TaxID=217090 RepID=UPI00203EBC6C|nr:hypothetical protein [Paenibacillus pasadenensis]MCM3747506.1 hypothetical protein [Paenibacillus pasadenensis]